MHISYQLKSPVEGNDWDALRDRVRGLITKNPGVGMAPNVIRSLVYREGSPRWRRVFSSKPVIGHLKCEHLNNQYERGFAFGAAESSTLDPMDDEFWLVDSLDEQECTLSLDYFSSFVVGALIVIAHFSPMDIVLTDVPVSVRKAGFEYARETFPFLSPPEWLGLSPQRPLDCTGIEVPDYLDFRA